MKSKLSLRHPVSIPLYLDDPSVCNGTIHLHDGLPAVLVRLSPGQLTRPLTCSVQIEIANSPIAGGLSAVVQELSVGKFDDPNNCTSFLKVSGTGKGPDGLSQTLHMIGAELRMREQPNKYG
ncbi:hypothetical protein FJT64_001444 [Amphibalanus amphitrite]|uniref:Uncharacterized protein n=1 Tax=Amphibalanus amphitrite TaxID=1232801 RepID=A0A6A4UVM8_AMPAM|nr:hypothetical protein FJT64_001444 [Amphibalanus amphitrite]